MTGDVFSRLIGALDGAGIPYMLTGSFASSYHGAPRTTQDIDLVIDPKPDQLRALIQRLPPSDYYANLEMALESQRQQTQFNIVDHASGWKVDLIFCKGRSFSRMEFSRRREVDFLGSRISIASVEDCILSKLEWSSMGESRRQLEDAARIISIRKSELDFTYIEHWIKELGLEELWKQARKLAEAGTG